MHVTRDPSDVNSSLSNDTITAICEGPERPPLGGDGRRVDPAGFDMGRVRRIGKGTGEPERLASVRINAICLDHQGGIWVGTTRGLAAVAPAGRDWRVFDATGIRSDRLDGDAVSALLVDRQGGLWVAGPRGVVRRDRAGGRFNRITEVADPAGDEPVAVSCLAEGAGGFIWAGTKGGGLHRWEDGSGRFEYYQAAQRGAEAEPLRHINALAADALGRLWAGTHGSGVVVIDPARSRHVHLLPDAGDSSAISYALVTSVFRDHSDTMWIGTHGKGLDFWNPYRQKFTRYRRDPANPTVA